MAASKAWSELRAFLGRRTQTTDPQEQAAIETEIRDRFTGTRAILISDMHGFSRITKRAGIVHFLGMIHRMLEMCEPLIAEHGGTLIKTIGDDMFVGFPDAESAVRCGMAMMTACDIDAETRPEDDRIRMAMGIGWGEMLDLDGEDLFGDEVNRASKLGEDIASPGEILVTQAVAEQIEGVDLKGWWMEDRSARISAISFRYCAIARVGDG